MSERLLLRPEEAAEMLGIGRSKLYELLAAGETESVRIGSSRRVPMKGLHDYVERLRAGRGLVDGTASTTQRSRQQEQGSEHQQQQTRRGVVYEVRFRGPDGREVSRWFRTKREAAAWEATQVAAVARSTYLDPAAANRTLKTVADEWLASNPAKRATSISRDVSVLRKHIVPTLGHRRIGLITKPEVQKLVNEWTTQMQPRTVVRTYGTLRAVFNYAVASDWIGRSPCRDINLAEAQGDQAARPDARRVGRAS